MIGCTKTDVEDTSQPNLERISHLFDGGLTVHFARSYVTKAGINGTTNTPNLSGPARTCG